HSFRKYFATNIYLNNNYNIELVRKILQHSSAAVTQKYIGIQQKDIELALQNNVRLV
ncbi:MAG: tyrosine-type recombinase/integrase, partial [Candidatus Pacebacteria bacterium]|nr:tyrosine-type recombinase/integrase [Candidatus Paceibacterota bacterium]